MTNSQLFEQLKKEAIERYGLPEPAVDQAIALNQNAFDVQQAHQNANGQAVKHPSLALLIVRGERGWYVVGDRCCSCGTHGMCVHRIAAWMHREIIIRPLAAAQKVSPAVIKAEFFPEIV